MTKPAMKHPPTEIDELRLQRSSAVLLLLRQKRISLEAIAMESGKNVGSIRKAIEGLKPYPEIIAFLEKKLGKDFAVLWKNYPNHSAA